VHPLVGHVLLVVYSVQERAVPEHAAVSYQEQPAATQAVLVVLVEQALGMPEHDPLGLPQAHSCDARQVARVALVKHGLAVVKQTTSHEHPVWARQDDWL
jgi:hypothetical protein